MGDGHSQLDQTPKPKPARFFTGFFWLMLAAIVSIIAAVGLSFWVPQLQHERSIDRIRKMGGSVATRNVGRSWQQQLLNEFRGEHSRQVIAIDLSGADMVDDDLRHLDPFKHVIQLSLSGHRLTEKSLEKVEAFPNLRFLMLVNCTGISDEAVKEFQKKHPYVQITRRGAALLGIYGQQGYRGCLVMRVSPGTAADRGGLLRGDEITQIDNVRLTRFDTLVRVLSRYDPGDTITVHVIRQDVRLRIPIELGKWGRQF